MSRNANGEILGNTLRRISPTVNLTRIIPDSLQTTRYERGEWRGVGRTLVLFRVGSQPISEGQLPKVKRQQRNWIKEKL